MILADAIPALAALVLAAAGAVAQTPLGAEAFERHVAGRTLTWSAEGLPYGIEEYRPDRTVVWSFLDGICREGAWYPADERICFVYETDDAPQCWSFFLDKGALVARIEPGPELRESGEVEGPPVCLGPVPGV